MVSCILLKKTFLTVNPKLSRNVHVMYTGMCSGMLLLLYEVQIPESDIYLFIHHCRRTFDLLPCACALRHTQILFLPHQLRKKENTRQSLYQIGVSTYSGNPSFSYNSTDGMERPVGILSNKVSFESMSAPRLSVLCCLKSI